MVERAEEEHHVERPALVCGEDGGEQGRVPGEDTCGPGGGRESGGAGLGQGEEPGGEVDERDGVPEGGEREGVWTFVSE